MPHGKIKKQKTDPNGKWSPVSMKEVEDYEDVVDVVSNWGEWLEEWAKKTEKHQHGGPVHPSGKYPPPPPPFEP